MKKGIVLAVAVFVVFSLFPLALAEDLFGVTPTHVSVGYQGSANIGYSNLQNWPVDVLQQFKDANDRAVAKCKTEGYDSWRVTRMISGYDHKLYDEKLFGTNNFAEKREKMKTMNSYDVDRWNQAFRDAAAVDGSIVLTYEDVIESVKCDAPEGRGTIVNVFVEDLMVSRSSTDTNAKTNNSKTYAASFSCQSWDCTKKLLPQRNIPPLIESVNVLLSSAPQKLVSVLSGGDVGIEVVGDSGVEKYIVSFEGSKVKELIKTPTTGAFSLTIRTTPDFLSQVVKSGSPGVTIQQAVKNGQVVLKSSGIVGKIAMEGINYYLTPAKKVELQTFTVQYPTPIKYNDEWGVVAPKIGKSPSLVTLPSKPSTPIVVGNQGVAIGYTSPVVTTLAEQIYAGYNKNTPNAKAMSEGIATLITSRYSNSAGVYQLTANNNPPVISKVTPLTTNNNAKNLYAGLTYGAGVKVAKTSNFMVLGRK